MKSKPELLIATNNKGKLEELQAILQDTGIRLIRPVDIGLDLDVEEDGQSYAENAIKKAVAFSQASGLAALADDSGLEVDVLEGAPGLHSKRFAPIPNATDADRRAYLLKQLNGKVRPWNAWFRATVAIASPGRSVEIVEGICPGEIIPEERGDGGFGYDPIFLLSDIDQTMAELAMEEKNRLSHRGRAVQKAIPILRKILELG